MIRRIESEHVKAFTVMHAVSRAFAIDRTFAAALPLAS